MKLLSLLVGVLLLVSAQAQNLIVNGDFESPLRKGGTVSIAMNLKDFPTWKWNWMTAWKLDGYGWVKYMMIPNQVISGKQTCYLLSANSEWKLDDTGKQGTLSAPSTTIYQEVAVEPGNVYLLSFKFGTYWYCTSARALYEVLDATTKEVLMQNEVVFTRLDSRPNAWINVFQEVLVPENVTSVLVRLTKPPIVDEPIYWDDTNKVWVEPNAYKYQSIRFDDVSLTLAE